MKKQRIFTVIAVALVAMLFSTGPVLAGDNPLVETFEGTRTRCEAVPGTTSYPDSRVKMKGQEASWSIDVDHLLVNGNWWNDMMVNRSADRSGMLHGKFEIYPDSMCDGTMTRLCEEEPCGPCDDVCDGEYLGYWEGSWLVFTQEGVAKFLRCQGKGMGLLKGLELKVDGGGGQVDAIFDGYILIPPSFDGE